MVTATDSQITVVRTHRGLSIAGTRITLYSIMDYLKADWPVHLIRDRLNLTDEQINDVMDYIDTHREDVEAEYELVLRKAEENKRYWQERNRDRFTKLVNAEPPPDKKVAWEKLQAKKKQLGLVINLWLMKLLVDHDIEGYAVLLRGTLLADGWLEIVEIDFIMLHSVGLPNDSSDRDIWRYAQDNNFVLLTNNRNMEDQLSLEQTIRLENTADSMPVITISDVQRLDEKSYRDRCSQRLAEIAFDIANYLGSGRIYIP